MRAVDADDRPLSGEAREAFASCIQCRGCETACPSGVPYGHLIESTRQAMADATPAVSALSRAGFAVLAHPRLLRAASTALAVAARARLLPSRLGLPANLPLRRPPRRTSGRDVWLFTGCVMDAWARHVHVAAQEVVEAAGFGVMPTGDAAPCCGALHAHAGHAERARTLAARVVRNLSGDAPILVDSAGCGAAMKEYGRLLGTADARSFAARVFDVHEWIAQHLDRLPAVEPLRLRVAVQDACHLRHVQHAHEATRVATRPFVEELVELDDDGLCCGAGGAFSLLQPGLARRVRVRKTEAIAAASADVVASANPGCSMFLADAGVPTVHPVELIRQALHQ
jgi:glycolate oxidase iron-sulfur subunit